MFGLCYFGGSVAAQEEIPLRNDRYIIWQPDARIELSDYTAQLTPKHQKLSERLGIGTVSTIQLLRIVDGPKRKRDAKELPERWYIAPAFCRACSSLNRPDSLGLAHDRIFFDMAELSARWARRQMDSLRTVLNIDNVGAAFIETVCMDADEMMHGLMHTYIKEVVLTRSDSAQASWRDFMHEMLDLWQYTTTQEDCQRFVHDAPLDERYNVLKYRSGDIRGRKKE